MQGCDSYLNDLNLLQKSFHTCLIEEVNTVNYISIRHEENEHKQFKKMVNKVMYTLTGRAQKVLVAFEERSNEFSTDLFHFHAATDSNPGDSKDEKDQAAQVQSIKHMFVVGTYICQFKGDIKKKETVIRKMLSVNHQHMDH